MLENGHTSRERGEWFFVREDDTVVAAICVLAKDDSTWGPRAPDALYVHGLVVTGNTPVGLLASGCWSGSSAVRWGPAERTSASRRRGTSCQMQGRHPG